MSFEWKPGGPEALASTGEVVELSFPARANVVSLRRPCPTMPTAMRSLAEEPHIGLTVDERRDLLLAQDRFDELEVRIEPEDRALWCYMRPRAAPSFTPSLLADLISVRKAIQASFETWKEGEEAPLRYFVGGSRLPGIYNLGGYLSLIADLVETRDREGLRLYARDCIDAVYHAGVAFDVPIVTIALLQGDALGGGLEAALAFNVLVAERGTRFGLPEVLFGLFPGMGAYNFLARRMDPARAEKVILSGRVFEAEEFHEMGLIDVLADPGEGEKAVREYIAGQRRLYDVHRSIYQIRQRTNPLNLDDLLSISELWVDTALKLTPADLRKMRRLSAAQTKRFQRS